MSLTINSGPPPGECSSPSVTRPSLSPEALCDRGTLIAISSPPPSSEADPHHPFRLLVGRGTLGLFPSLAEALHHHSGPSPGRHTTPAMGYGQLTVRSVGRGTLHCPSWREPPLRPAPRPLPGTEGPCPPPGPFLPSGAGPTRRPRPPALTAAGAAGPGRRGAGRRRPRRRRSCRGSAGRSAAPGS